MARILRAEGVTGSSAWFVPSRRVLGDALMRSGAPHDPEIVSRDDLRQSPNNRWALRGLGAVQAARGNAAESPASGVTIQDVWSLVDFAISDSAY